MRIYNGKPIMLLKDLERILSLPVNSIRLDFNFEENEIKIL